MRTTGAFFGILCGMGIHEERQELLTHIRYIAMLAGGLMTAGFSRFATMEVDWKAEGRFATVVTEIDKLIHDMVVREAANFRLPLSVTGEEGQHRIRSAMYTAMPDEMDGSALFMRGIPLSVFSLAVIDAEGNPVVGVVEEPLGVLRRRYWAVAGEPSYYTVNNGPEQQLRVSTKELGPQSMIDAEWWPAAPHGYDFMPALHDFSRQSGTYYVTIGSVIAALMAVARGDFEACVFAGATPEKKVDSAAAGLIIKGAGGAVMDLHGNTDLRYRDEDVIHGLLATNGQASVRNTLLDVCRPLL